MDKPWKVILAFVGVFIAGAVVGGVYAWRLKRPEPVIALSSPAPVVSSAVAPAAVTTPTMAATTPSPDAAAAPAAGNAAPGPRPPRNTGVINQTLSRMLTQRLQLTADQREKVEPIIGDTAEELRRMRQEFERQRQRGIDEASRITDQMYSDIASILTASQKAELQALRRESQERVEAERRRPGGGPEMRKGAPGAGRPQGATEKKSRESGPEVSK